MSVNIKTVIEFKEDNFFGFASGCSDTDNGDSVKTIKNFIEGALENDSPKLQTNSNTQKSWVLDTTQGAAFTEDLMSLIDFTAEADVKAIHVHAHKLVQAATDNADPILFTVSLTDGTNTLPMGKMSQFQMINTDGMPLTGITISNVEVASKCQSGVACSGHNRQVVMNLYYTVSTKTHEPQPNPARSRWEDLWSNSLFRNGQENALFGPIRGGRVYRALMLKNETGADISTPINLYYENRSASPVATYKMALVTPDMGSGCPIMEKIDFDTQLPSIATFMQNQGSSRALQIPSLANNAYMGIWIQRDVNQSIIDDRNSCDTLYTEFSLEKLPAIYNIKFTPDVAGSLNQQYFFFYTTQTTYLIYYDVGGTASFPTVPGGIEVIRIAIAQDDDPLTVATKTFNELTFLWGARDEVTMELVGSAITFTATQTGSVQAPAGTVPFNVTEEQAGVGSLFTNEDVDIYLEW